MAKAPDIEKHRVGPNHFRFGKQHRQQLKHNEIKDVLDACNRNPLYAFASPHFIKHDIPPAEVKARLAELDDIRKAAAQNGLAHREAEILRYAARAYEEPGDSIGAMLALIREENDPDISNHIPVGPRPNALATTTRALWGKIHDRRR